MERARGDAIDMMETVLCMLGFDPSGDDLSETPRRWVDAMIEMTRGYDQDPAKILGRVFTSEEYDELVLVRDIEFASLCEHHLLPFTGVAHVAYIPSNGKVVGLSKIPRLVEVYARRLQLQERLTVEIAGAMEKHLSPVGVAVVITASHQCMSCRGVRKPGARMVTSKLTGGFRTNAEARAEVLALVNGG